MSLGRSVAWRHLWSPICQGESLFGRAYGDLRQWHCVSHTGLFCGSRLLGFCGYGDENSCREWRPGSDIEKGFLLAIGMLVQHIHWCSDE